jgi:hypothetical protein
MKAPGNSRLHYRPSFSVVIRLRMKVSDFQFDLPEALIAQRPLAQRSASRLLHLERAAGALDDRMFADLPTLLSLVICWCSTTPG